MPEQQVFLHYINADEVGRLPHALEFGPIYGRIVTDRDITGRVVTVICYGMPRRFYIWSVFNANQRSVQANGTTVIHGEGHHLCPPREVPEKNIHYLVQGQLKEHLFIPIVDPRVAKWLLKIADSYKPPGDPVKLKAFLTQMSKDIGNEEIEIKIKKAMKGIKARA